jgi:quinol monooxygenase YgiN
MICALTVRKLRPGSFDEFRKAFMEPVRDQEPEGMVRFNMIRNAADPDEVICFGIFEGGVEQVRAAAAGDAYRRQQEAIAPHVQSVGTDGVFEIVEELSG